MRRYALAALLSAALGFGMPLAAVSSAEAVTVNINIGSNLNNGRAITCAQGQRLIRSRGFRDVRQVNCRGRHFVYHARRPGGGTFEIVLNSRTGRVVDFHRIRR